MDNRYGSSIGSFFGGTERDEEDYFTGTLDGSLSEGNVVAVYQWAPAKTIYCEYRDFSAQFHLCLIAYPTRLPSTTYRPQAESASQQATTITRSRMERIHDPVAR